MSIQKNTIATNQGTAGNAVGDTISQAASMAQAALVAGAESQVYAEAWGGYANANLGQKAEARGSEDNTSFGNFNVQF